MPLGKKERGVDIDNLKYTSYFAIEMFTPLRHTCGGGFPALPPFASAQGVPSKLLDIIPLAQSHTVLALGTDWSPRSNSIVAFEGKLQQHAFNDSRRRLLGYLPDTAPNSGEFALYYVYVAVEKITQKLFAIHDADFV
ncbi:hypothetical protein EDB85DRAFT_2145645 [Lactarius pseudohatsudake]|nr:hypothetical protein EDB85DRAFT_2145645 [Lactarius pseudohatsudake]